MPDLLFELLTEEIPAAYLPAAIEALKREAAERLRAVEFSPKSVLATGTPRRLTLYVEELPIAQAGKNEEVAGPPEKAAYAGGEPTAAARKFAEKNGVRVEDLVVKETPKGRYVYATRRLEGRSTPGLLAEILPAAVRAIPFPKSMRWPQAPGLVFARPIRRVLALFGRDVVPLEIGGVKAGRTTLGHPFTSGARELAVDRADYAGYRTLLKGHGVVVDRNERRAAIERALEEVFAAHGAKLERHELLEEVTDLVELPEVLVGAFDPKYLRLPREVVEAAMTDHQRYFPIPEAGGKLAPKFAFVANRPKERAGAVREGNERVLRARLEDAAFYLQEDLKRTLNDRAGALAGISFHEKLGSMDDKSKRLVRAAERFAAILELPLPDREAAVIAAFLAKTDLTTELVKEFPELQGVIGSYYAALQGKPPEVARALREQYLPRFARDELPKTSPGVVLALAEKLDNVCGFFSVGLVPSGSADPYGLRRQAAGVVRIVSERELPVSLRALVEAAAAPFNRPDAPAEKTAQAVLEFIRDRAKQSFLDQGARYDLVDAALGAGSDDLVDARRRLEALAHLAKDPSFPELCELVERTWNIS